MSLINDALRRARQAQQSPPAAAAPAPAPRVRTPVRRVKAAIPWAPAISLAGAGVTALVIAWNWSVHRSRAPIEANARPLTTAPAASAVPTSSRGEETPRPGQGNPAVSVLEHKPGTARASGAEVSGSALKNVPDPSGAGAEGTNSPLPIAQVTLVTPSPAPPPQPKLQSIIYHPRRPSAMIDGKVLFVGDKWRDMRVTEITATGATLAGPSRTNHLEL